MMASMGPSFTPHPGAMQQHPGIPQGHPGLAPGMAHNPSQPGQPGAIPQHIAAQMGVSGPGGPQMNPAAMMAAGMPPGAGGPGAHAMQHLTPQQAMIFQQQQQQQMNSHMAMVNSPAIQAQLQQQRILQQQQQQRQQMMLQQQHGGMYNPNIIQANQIAALRRMGQNMQDPRAQAMLAQQNAMQQINNQGHNPNQLQLQQAQLAAMQQAQAQAQQAQAQAQAQQVQQAQAQAQAQQAQAVAAAQQAQAQQAQAHAQAQQAQQHAQVQQAHQQQQAQQAQHAQQHAQQAHQAAQQGGPGQPQPQQTPQPGIPGQQGPSQPQTPQQPGQPGGPPPPSGPGGPQMTPQMVGQPQPPQQGPGGPHQPPQMQHHPMLQQNALAMQQAQQQQFANALQQQKREPIKNQCFLKLSQFSEMLGSFPGPKGRDETSFWNELISRFFSTSGMFRHSIHMVNGGEKTNKQYEIPYPALARYFHTYFESGVKKMQIITDHGFTEKSMNDKFCVENPKASLVQWFEGNAHVVSSGVLRVNFDTEQKFELFEFVCDSHEEFLPRKMVIQAAQPGHKWIKEWRSLNQSDSKQSPEISKKGKPKPMKSPQTAPPDVQLPHSSVKESVGITEAVYQFLEVVEVMGHMTPLFMHCHTHPDQTAIASLDQLVQHLNSTSVPSANGQMAIQGGPRTPGMGQFPMGASPHVAHLPAPGSPHVGSPAPGTMQAPGMHPSQSQQGTASSGPSANTSPAGTKRRRPSGVKAEDDMNGGPTSMPTPNPQVNGLQGKAKPPTPRMQKKQKVNSAS